MPVQQPHPGVPVQQTFPGVPVQQPHPGVPVQQTFPGVPVQQPHPGVPVQQPHPGVPVQQTFPGVPVQQPHPGVTVQQPHVNDPRGFSRQSFRFVFYSNFTCVSEGCSFLTEKPARCSLVFVTRTPCIGVYQRFSREKKISSLQPRSRSNGIRFKPYPMYKKVVTDRIA